MRFLDSSPQRDRAPGHFTPAVHARASRRLVQPPDVCPVAQPGLYCPPSLFVRRLGQPLRTTRSLKSDESGRNLRNETVEGTRRSYAWGFAGCLARWGSSSRQISQAASKAAGTRFTSHQYPVTSASTSPTTSPTPTTAAPSQRERFRTRSTGATSTARNMSTRKATIDPATPCLR